MTEAIWMQSMQLPLDLSSVGRARRFFSTVAEAAAVPAQVIESGKLALSELVTNALVHGEEPIAVTAFVCDACVRVEVSDGADRLPQLSAPSVDRERGRGLAIVEAVTQAWGCDSADHGHGKSVWFQLNSGVLAS